MRIGLGFALLAFLIFSAVAIVSGQQARRQVGNDIGESLTLLASRMAASLDNGLFERYREIQNVASFSELFATEDQPDRWRPVLEQLQRTYQHYAWIGVTDADGTVVAATGGLLETRDVSQRPWFKEARSAPFVGDVHEAVLLASLLPGLTGSEPPRFVDVAAPIVRGDRKIGVLGAHLSWKWAEERRQNVLKPVEAERRVDVLIVDRDGNPLLGPLGRADARLPQSRIAPLLLRGHGTETWNDGQDYLTAAVRASGHRDYAGLGWTVLVRQPIDTALAPARQLQWQIVGIGLLGAGLFGLFGWWLAGRLTAPLRDVARQAQALAVEGWPGAGDGRPRNEIAQLSTSLGTLMSRLQQRGQELLRLNETLEQRVSERTQALELANADLKSFSHSVSHDLKGPIGSMGMALRQVLDQEGERLDARSRNLLKLLTAECDRLRLLVDELMVLAQVEQQDLQHVVVPMEDLARSVADQLRSAQPVDAGRAVEVVIAELPQVEGDAILLEQVWQNLLANAFKFSRRTASPRVEITAETTDDEVAYCVSDNGAGFDMRQAARLFGAFQRLHRSSEFPGTGIGLSIVKRVVHRHGGRVWAHSIPGQRTSFHFALPRRNHFNKKI
ncbi:sensor histidine kinase [Methylibium petroleiphilum]|uniref:sensor histidine kinase n=1 Tax=Methylibium petroleiphilum TaxID=105560 RepID=UPI002357BDEA|nr:ATP-binding protein [Methylibium petroleiphilum]